MKSIIHLLFLILIVTACDIYPQDEYEEQYVIEAYLVADRQLPQIRLSTTVEAGVSYSFEDVAVENATVELRLLEADAFSETEESFDYTITAPGIYKTTVEHKVKPLRTYELNISFPNSNDLITAHTIVPDTFHIQKGVQDTIEYRSEGQLEITISESSYPGRQNIFIFNTISQNPIAENLTPMYKSFYEEEGEDPADLAMYANSSSGILNEGNFEINPDGSFTIQYPWVGFTFYEENLLVANTIDDNVYDFIRSQTVQLGGSTLSPGEIQNVVTNIKGGVGIFGSLASDTTSIFIKRPNQQ